MRTKWAMAAGMAMVVASCTQAATRGSRNEPVPVESNQAQAAPLAGSHDLLILGSGSGLEALDPATGSILYGGPAVPSFADWSQLFTATRTAGRTLLNTTDAATGATSATALLRGDLSIRVASSDGRRVALMAPLPQGVTPWKPVPRAFTTIVVADPTGIERPMRFRLQGNFEPEAFSADDSMLFLIRYLPATAPVAYRVVLLDLDDGEIYPTLGRDKSWNTEKMNGTRFLQVPSLDGTRLYTLYTTQPAEYAAGYDAVQARAGGPVAFIHTLGIDGSWAHCVPLPKSMWDGRPEDETVAVSPDGRSLYAVDAARALVAVMDTEDLAFGHARRVDLGSLGRGPVHAAVAPDGRSLFVARGAWVVELDLDSSGVRRAWPMAGSVSGLGFSADGQRLYVALPDQVEVMDPTSGRQLRMVPAPGIAGIEHVETVTT